MVSPRRPERSPFKRSPCVTSRPTSRLSLKWSPPGSARCQRYRQATKVEQDGKLCRKTTVNSIKQVPIVKVDRAKADHRVRSAKTPEPLITSPLPRTDRHQDVAFSQCSTRPASSLGASIILGSKPGSRENLLDTQDSEFDMFEPKKVGLHQPLSINVHDDHMDKEHVEQAGHLGGKNVSFEESDYNRQMNLFGGGLAVKYNSSAKSPPIVWHEVSNSEICNEVITEPFYDSNGKMHFPEAIKSSSETVIQSHGYERNIFTKSKLARKFDKKLNVKEPTIMAETTLSDDPPFLRAQAPIAAPRQPLPVEGKHFAKLVPVDKELGNDERPQSAFQAEQVPTVPPKKQYEPAAVPEAEVKPIPEVVIESAPVAEPEPISAPAATQVPEAMREREPESVLEQKQRYRRRRQGLRSDPESERFSRLMKKSKYKIPEVVIEPEPVPEPTPEPEAVYEPIPESEPEPEPEPKLEPEPEPEPEPESESEPEPEAEPEPDPQPEAETESELERESESGTEPELETESEPEPQRETEVHRPPEPVLCQPKIQKSTFWPKKPDRKLPRTPLESDLDEPRHSPIYAVPSSNKRVVEESPKSQLEQRSESAEPEYRKIAYLLECNGANGFKSTVSEKSLSERETTIKPFKLLRRKRVNFEEPSSPSPPEPTSGPTRVSPEPVSFVPMTPLATDHAQSGPHEARNQPRGSGLLQQRLDAWQPILTPGTVLPAFLLIGLAFVPIGVLLLVTSDNVQQFRYDYTNCSQACDATPCNCTILFDLDDHYDKDVFLYYSLTNYFQNHRRYVRSKDTDQLHKGRLKADPYEFCEPFDYVNGKPIAPCGIIANSIFNDTFQLFLTYEDPFKPDAEVTLDMTDISWVTDKENKYKNPRNMTEAFRHYYAKPVAWPVAADQLDPLDPGNNGYTNERFMVWMRVAAFSTFRKLYARVLHKKGTRYSGGLPKGSYKMAHRVHGQKWFILSNTSWLGGKSTFLGVSYIVVGVLILLLDAFLFYSIRRYKVNDDHFTSIDKKTPFYNYAYEED
ncbi:Cell cycle control protein 50A [Halotydeus destructor]|nr:Cell cycle control protein 50A [Halotydeus destructor]